MQRGASFLLRRLALAAFSGYIARLMRLGPASFVVLIVVQGVGLAQAAAQPPHMGDVESDVRTAPDEVPTPTVRAVAPGAPSIPEPISEIPDHEGKFVFGSYGRVVVASDLEGQSGQSPNIVTHGSRIDEGTYAELELRREDRFGTIDTRVVATLAIAGPLFHFDGDFDADIAVRNLYAEAAHVGLQGLDLWAGSRMVRGDDIYLLDYWPLDNLNMVGGGVRYRFFDNLDARLSVGLARPNDPFQLEIDQVLATAGFETESVYVLDRPRLVVAGKVDYRPLGEGDLQAKVVAYAEGHSLPSGERTLEAGGTERLPPDQGYVLGTELGVSYRPWNAHLNFFLRYARGLGAYDPLGVPFASDSPISTARAEELVVAASGNIEWGPLAVQLGGYYRRFRDADPNLFERGLLAEGAVSLRPTVWFLGFLGLSLEGSVQSLDTTSLNDRTGEVDHGTVYKFGVIPFVSPAGKGSFSRPHIRIIYNYTFRDQAARALYGEDNPRRHSPDEHYLGVGAEWWFDSSSY